MTIFIYYSLAPIQALFNFTIGSLDGTILYSERLLDEDKKTIGKEALLKILKDTTTVVMYEEESKNLMCEFLDISMDAPMVFLSDKASELMEDKIDDQRVYDLEECLHKLHFSLQLDKRFPTNYIRGLIFLYKKVFKNTLWVYDKADNLVKLSVSSPSFKSELKEVFNRLFQTDPIKYPILVTDTSKDRIVNIENNKCYQITNNYKARQYYKKQIEETINKEKGVLYVGEMTYSEYPSDGIDDILKENLVNDFKSIENMVPGLILVRFDIKSGKRYLPHIYYILLKK